MKKQYLSLQSMIALKAFIVLSLIISSIGAYGQDGGVIRTTDYGTTPTSGGAYFWRGYSFKLTQETVVTHIIGGGIKSTTNECDDGPCFSGAIFSSGVNDDHERYPKEILAQVYFAGDEVNQEESITNLTLQPDTWYFIAQGDLGGSSADRVHHWYVEEMDVDDLLLASQRIDDWEPEATEGCHYWTAGDPANVVVGEPSRDPNDSRPALGIRYETTASLPEVETLSTPLRGKLTDRGEAATALYIEYGTDEDLESGTTLNLAESAYEGDTPYEYGSTASGLDPSTTYYYRARAINDAGRDDGEIKSFTTPDAPGAPNITSIEEGNEKLSVSFDAPDPDDVDNYQYSFDNGDTWTSRSPASDVSPLVIEGLTNGITYDVQIRAVNQGIEGDASNTKDGTPRPPAPTNITGEATQLCVGGSTELTAEGDQGTVYWFEGSCAETGEIDTGNSITVSPSSTTTYYARNYENGVFSTDCASIEIKVLELQQFRSKASGDWTHAGNWEQWDGSDWVQALCYPGQFDGTDPDAQVSILATHEMEIDDGTDIDIPNLEIEDTGKLYIKNGGKLTVQEELKLDESSGAAIMVEHADL